jgi:spore maturation protein CgeB
MNTQPLNIVILGLSITSSWGNGHATTYRALVRGLEQRGHQVLFLERDMPWYAAARDQTHARRGRTVLYRGFPQLKKRFHETVRDADLVVVGSYVPDGIEIGQWVV